MRTNTLRQQARDWRVQSLLLLMAVSGWIGWAGTSRAAETFILDEPLATRPNVKAKPNMLFVLDDSGSMNWSYMPDELGASVNATDQPYTGKYGYWTPQCNGTAFDPSLAYPPPLNADGSSFPNSSFRSARSDGFAGTGSVDLGATEAVTTARTSTSSATIGNGSRSFTITGSGNSSETFVIGKDIKAEQTTNSSRWMTGTVTGWSGSGNTWTLTINVTNTGGGGDRSGWSISQLLQVGTRYYYTYTATGAARQPAMAWTYGADGNVITSPTFYRECMSDIGSSPGSSVFTKVLIASQPADVQQNYANWYSYYRKRTFLMRTAVGRAFSVLNDGYRVGFTTINTTSAVDGPGFQSIADFGTTQKNTVYEKLYAASANGSTPLRAALSKAGRYFANKMSGQTDPVQYSCQRNYTLLSTDGYWNTGSESSSYGPFKLDGSSNVNNQDATEERPMYDGTSIVVTRNAYTVGTLGSCRLLNQNRYNVSTQRQTFSSGAWTNDGSPTTSCVTGGTTITNGQTASTLAGTVANGSSVTETTGGATNTLADVAQYYYQTDLRTTALGNCTSSASGTQQNVCSNNIPASGRDTAPHQHMTTFTIGLGVNGTLAYDRNYLTQTAGDFVNLKNGSISWPEPGSDRGATNIDDLWHGAVNGRGQYYSALNASALSEAVSGVVNSIQEQNGSSSAASTSALELVAGDNNQVFKASYTTKTWAGDLQAYTLNGDTAAISATPVWSAQAILTNTAASSRKIFYRRPTATTTLRAFNWTNLNADGYGTNFSNLCSQTLVASQCSGLSSAEATLANTGANLVDFLRGTRTFETANSASGTTRALYRTRVGPLGDIINGAPVYVSKPPFSYTDTGYVDFVLAKKTRKPAVYVAANDGMLHAFSAATADGGTELWAYVPSELMPNLYRLADAGYESRHRYFVDGAPVIGDIRVGNTWKTILVGGLNKGGRSYYALDITDPEDPKALWEFSDTNLGLTYGNPVITKNKDGVWTVVFASGYNNISNGDGKGHLFVLNANTGAKILDIPTTAGTTTDPSGLAKINGWIDDSADNTSKRFYGGDLFGNLWRFDVDNLVQPNRSALLLAEFKINATTPQPITVKPETVEISGKPVIVVATGKYFGTADIEDTTQQSIYAVKDALTNTGLGDVRTNNTMVRQTFTVTGVTASITSNQVNWGTQNGWWVDLPNTGERVATDMALQFGTLSIGTAIPSGDACSSGGSSWRYYLNAANGNALEDPAGEQWSANALIVGQSWVKLENGETRILRQNSDGTIKTERPPGGGGAAGVPHRNSWRELTD
ncbi:Tfp pilus assembly protein, tip-associated adhesin PilY1 [Variovorax sp. PBL-H6]|uniref:pilus assembly protein n=1 Tax=Variovorax sp. PBL-H6 TaxID=434009 RepID=UPI0013188D41|nr:PilC/PilY family type IV pilus protein [Variovorax sp. PBL-H6]VTU39088.1 Tfp pilus assembly protein, tip-associated adhesin PilY1 [Variovorax sp. PBL-H6]